MDEEWKVAEDCGDSGALAVYNAAGRKIALVFGREMVARLGRNAEAARAAGEKLAQARARMIAAAPVMLATLERVNKAALHPDSELHRAVRAAIAEAKLGE